jgi:hypothetical protein
MFYLKKENSIFLLKFFAILIVFQIILNDSFVKCASLNSENDDITNEFANTKVILFQLSKIVFNCLSKTINIKFSFLC